MDRRAFRGRIFDADNHLYETEDAFTRHLPAQYEGVFKYVQVHGRTKIAVNNVISEYIPNPTFEVVGRPGSLADYFGGNNSEGRTPREIIGEPMRSVDAFRSPGARLALLTNSASTLRSCSPLWPASSRFTSRTILNSR